MELRKGGAKTRAQPKGQWGDPINPRREGARVLRNTGVSGRGDRAQQTSLVVDPPNGQTPEFTADAKTWPIVEMPLNNARSNEVFTI